MKPQLASSDREKKRALALPVVVAATLSLIFFKAESSNIIRFPIVSNAYVDSELKYQLITLGLAAVVLALVYVLGPKSFRKFFALGKVGAPVEPVKLIGIGPNETWLQIGRNFSIIISLVTLGFIYFQAIQGQTIDSQNLGFLPLIILFALSNSFVEEMITRFSVVSALDQLMPRQYIYLVSATIFGIAHYYGVPGGIAGVLLAGFLGWLLAKSIAETEGIFWAWLIHFLQDVIIFTGLFFLRL
jgi:membrane protease YdiL (CAAX protease family)